MTPISDFKRLRPGLWVLCILLISATAESQKNREAAQRAFDRGYQFQTGRGIMKNLEAAYLAYREAISLDPSYADAYYNFAQVCSDVLRFDLAELAYKNYLKFQPNEVTAIHDLGVVLHRQGKYDAAIRQYRRALELNPNLSQAHYNLGNVYYALKKEDLAIQEWDRAIQLDPENETYLHRRERFARIKRQKESPLSPDTVWWIMYGLGGVFVIYCLVYWARRRKG